MTSTEWRGIKEVFGNRCAYCGCSDNLTMDHVVALSRGGVHAPDNIVPACLSCNSRKQARGVLYMVNTNYEQVGA